MHHFYEENARPEREKGGRKACGGEATRMGQNVDKKGGNGKVATTPSYPPIITRNIIDPYEKNVLNHRGKFSLHALITGRWSKVEKLN